MIRGIVVMLMIGVVIFCAFGARTAAQTNPACTTFIQYCVACGDAPLPGQYNCIPEGPYLSSCSIANYLCPPPPPPFCKCGVGGAPISLASGDTYITQKDIRLPGLSEGLNLERTWNSLWDTDIVPYSTGMFGPHWRSTFEEQLVVGGTYIEYIRGSGDVWFFGFGPAYVLGTAPGGRGFVWSLASPANSAATLTLGSSYWTMTFQNGEQRLFDNNTGKLTEIIDRNGNATLLSYDSSHRLVTATDPVSRHLYFSYGTGTGTLVISVTSDTGLSLSYSYDMDGRLSQYTKTDGTTVSFTYDTNSFISSVLDEDGKVLESHTYDSTGRGLTSSRAGGVEAIAITY